MLLSAGFNFVEEWTIVIPHSVDNLLKLLHVNMTDKSSEFGIYLKATLNPDTGKAIIKPVNIETGENFYVPKQQVSAASIVFNEPPPDSSFNCIIHRHPKGCTSFSSTDMNSINQEFAVSLIYIPNEPENKTYPDNLINLKINEDTFLRFRKQKVEVKQPLLVVSELVLEAIKGITSFAIPGVRTLSSPTTGLNFKTKFKPNVSPSLEDLDLLGLANMEEDLLLEEDSLLDDDMDFSAFLDRRFK